MDTPVNEEQRRLWNGCGGRGWIEAQETLDALFKSFEERLTQAVIAAQPRSVLDVGCGTGATTLAIARALGQGASVTGIDISQPMVEFARRRAGRAGVRAEFIAADAQTHDFLRGACDLIVSRFGVMFFADPVAAFANLRRAARPGAALRCVAFRSAAENPFMTAAERAAAPLLPSMPPRRPGGPGQFAWADARRTQELLDAAGWKHIEILPLDVHCAMPATALDEYLLRLGPVGLALRDADEATRMRVTGVVRAAFAPYLQGDEVRFTAACWEVAALA